MISLNSQSNSVNKRGAFGTHSEVPLVIGRILAQANDPRLPGTQPDWGWGLLAVGRCGRGPRWSQGGWVSLNFSAECLERTGCFLVKEVQILRGVQHKGSSSSLAYSWRGHMTRKEAASIPWGWQPARRPLGFICIINMFSIRFGNVSCCRIIVWVACFSFSFSFMLLLALPPSFPSFLSFSLVAQSCLTLCDPMNCSTQGLPAHHQLLEFTQTHVHRVGDAIQPSHPLSSPSPPVPNRSSIRVFSNESTLHMRWPKY